jgi:hypothetical protein
MQNIPPEVMAQALAAGGGAPQPSPGGAPPAAAGASPDGAMSMEQAAELLASMGITPDNASMVAEALMLVAGGAEGAPTGAPPPGAPMPPA